MCWARETGLASYSLSFIAGLLKGEMKAHAAEYPVSGFRAWLSKVAFLCKAWVTVATTVCVPQQLPVFVCRKHPQQFEPGTPQGSLYVVGDSQAPVLPHPWPAQAPKQVLHPPPPHTHRESAWRQFLQCVELRPGSLGTRGHPSASPRLDSWPWHPP